jgi:hypothetical protein
VGQGLLDVTIDAEFAAGEPLSDREVFELDETHDRAATKFAVESAAGGSDSPDPSGVGRGAFSSMPRRSAAAPDRER